MRIAILTTQVPFISGGAEILASGLKDALIQRGHQAELVTIPFKWYPPETLQKQIQACSLLDVSSFADPVDLTIALKFPAYLASHPKKVLWLVHQHRMAYDFWGTPYTDLNTPVGEVTRHAIIQADQALLESCEKRYTISKNVSARLLKYNGLESQPLYPPPSTPELYYCAEGGDYLFFPSRLNHSKRQRLVIQALALTRHPVRVVFAGAPDCPARLSELTDLAAQLGVADRVEILDHVSETRKIRLYAESLAVVFPPVDEDYGYVTIEAMLASKAVITCTDSGGPLEFVKHRETGWICESQPTALAEAMDQVWNDQRLARKLGQGAREQVQALKLGWDPVIGALLS